MRTIIAGSRSIITYKEVDAVIRSCPWVNEITVILSGTARGVDKLGERYAEYNNITVEQYPADWSLGKQAGYLRNVEMANNADALITIWDGSSPGTTHMLNIAEKKGLRIWTNVKKIEIPEEDRRYHNRDFDVKNKSYLSQQSRNPSKPNRNRNR